MSFKKGAVSQDEIALTTFSKEFQQDGKKDSGTFFELSFSAI